MNFPKLKKKISAFISKEDGKITKQALLTLGTLLASAAAVSIFAQDVAAWSHTNTLTPFTYVESTHTVSIGHFHHLSNL